MLETQSAQEVFSKLHVGAPVNISSEYFADGTLRGTVSRIDEDDMGDTIVEGISAVAGKIEGWTLWLDEDDEEHVIFYPDDGGLDDTALAKIEII